jgi:hypothetical protein
MSFIAGNQNHSLSSTENNIKRQFPSDLNDHLAATKKLNNTENLLKIKSSQIGSPYSLHSDCMANVSSKMINNNRYNNGLIASSSSSSSVSSSPSVSSSSSSSISMSPSSSSVHNNHQQLIGVNGGGSGGGGGGGGNLSKESIKNAIKLCRRRKARTVFSDQQLSGLEKRFERQKYLSTPERMELANNLGLSETQVSSHALFFN